ncbi:MAG: hypothetical protein H0U62_01800 [Actinobacteria bacterium]|nr:hypothetical protein [Actinomycetota bacterium]
MKRLVEIPLDDSGAVVIAEVEVDDDNEDGYVRAAIRTPDEVADKVGGSVQSALEKMIRPTAALVMDQLRHLQPDGVEVQFGLTLVGKAGVVFASSEVEGHLQVTLTWNRDGDLNSRGIT